MWLWERFMDFFAAHEQLTAWSIAIIGTILIWIIGYLLFLSLGLID